MLDQVKHTAAESHLQGIWYGNYTWTEQQSKSAGSYVTMSLFFLNRSVQEQRSDTLPGTEAKEGVLMRIIHFVCVFVTAPHTQTHTHTPFPPLCQYWIRATHRATGVCVRAEDPHSRFHPGGGWEGMGGGRERACRGIKGVYLSQTVHTQCA